MIKEWRWHIILVAILVAELGLLMLSPAAPAEARPMVARRHTGFDCLLPIEDRWISCSRFPHLEAKA
jgi:hypothetical protein